VCDLAEVEVTLAEWEHDLTSGLVFPEAARPLFPHERAAGFNALASENELATAANRLTGLLLTVRETWIARLVADLRTRVGAGDALDRLVKIDANLSVLAAPIIDETTRAAEQIIRAAATAGTERLVTEALTQKAVLNPIAVTAGDLGVWIKAEAAAVARSPIADLTGTVRQEVTGRPWADAASVADAVVDAAGKASVLRLESDYGRVPVQQAWGRARTETADAADNTPRAIYASELLDRRTCKRGRGDIIDRCAEVDGRQYASMASARADYPTATYVHCWGGYRCRGTLVYVWAESDPNDFPAVFR
jgi:hypothetical protein